MIKTKEKKCSGTGKAKGSGCGELQFKRTYGLGHQCGCYQKWLLETEEGRKVISSRKIKASVKVKSEIKKKESQAKKEFKEKNKSIAALILEARKPFQQWIRLRDANNACISCGQTNTDLWDAGHFKKAELYTGLIFDERNIHKQCRKCNTYLNGNEGEYRKRLLEKFGSDWMKQLDDDADRLRQYSWTREELYDIKKKYSEKIKEIIK
jgi:hypothetical protein